MTLGERTLFHNAVVVGGGPTGLTADLYPTRTCCRVLILEQRKFGGQITITAKVMNYSSTAPVSSKTLTVEIRRQAENFGVESLLAEATGLKQEDSFFVVGAPKGNFRVHDVILTTDAHPRTIGFPGEAEYKGHDIAYCMTCDDGFLTSHEVFVVGGGFATAGEAVFLTRYASHMTILIREPDFTYAAKATESAEQHGEITIKYDTETEEVSGDGTLRYIHYRNTKTGEVTEFSLVDGGSFGTFVSAGYASSSSLLKGLTEIGTQGYVPTDWDRKTGLDGLYTVGDVCGKSLHQAVTATGNGAVAAIEFEKHIAERQKGTGTKTDIQIRRAAVHTAQDGTPATVVVQSDDAPFDSAMMQQLNAIFSRLTEELMLKLYTDEGAVSSKLRHYLEALTTLSDRLTLSEENAPDSLASHDTDTALLYVRVFREDGSYVGPCLHGVSDGHEFISFVLGLYNAGSKGQLVIEEALSRIAIVDKGIRTRILVNLSCTMCPELVTSAQRLTTLNPHITAGVFSLNRFSAFRERYKMVSVPYFLVNGEPPQLDKKDFAQFLDLSGA